MKDLIDSTGRDDLLDLRDRVGERLVLSIREATLLTNLIDRTGEDASRRDLCEGLESFRAGLDELLTEYYSSDEAADAECEDEGGLH